MSVALIVTRGYGNGTLSGDTAKVVTRGYNQYPGVYSITDTDILQLPIDYILNGQQPLWAKRSRVMYEKMPGKAKETSVFKAGSKLTKLK